MCGLVQDFEKYGVRIAFISFRNLAPDGEKARLLVVRVEIELLIMVQVYNHGKIIL